MGASATDGGGTSSVNITTPAATSGGSGVAAAAGGEAKPKAAETTGATAPAADPIITAPEQTVTAFAIAELDGSEIAPQTEPSAAPVLTAKRCCHSSYTWHRCTRGSASEGGERRRHYYGH